MKKEASPNPLALAGININCPECGSDLIFDLETKFECDECGHVWTAHFSSPLPTGGQASGESKNAERRLPPCMAGVIRTFSGKMLNVVKPNPDHINIEDIAHALAVIPRFGGQTKLFYSVAEHSIRVAELLPMELKLAGLLHDASEAYIGDVQSPIKILLPNYYQIEDKLMKAIARKFGFDYPWDIEVDAADRALLELEWRWLVDQSDWLNFTVDYARERFLDDYYEYSKIKAL